MPIFRSIGFGIFIITMALLLPDVLSQGKKTAISFLRGAELSADVASSIAASAALAPTSAPNAAGSTAPFASRSLPPLVLPRTPSIPDY